MSTLLRLGNYISTKSNFVKASIWMFGIPVGVFLAFITSEYGPWMPVLSLLIAPVVGYIWGLAMWHLYFAAIFANRAQPPEAKQGTQREV